MKTNRKGHFLSPYHWYINEFEKDAGFSSHVIIEDETWAHFRDPEKSSIRWIGDLQGLQALRNFVFKNYNTKAAASFFGISKG